MGSLPQELARREAAARERVEAIAEQIEQLRERLAAEERVLSRLVITRETVQEILGEAAGPAQQPPAGTDSADNTGGGATASGSASSASSASSGSSGGSSIGVITVPRWRPGMDASVLPGAYQDVLGVLIDAGQAMRAGQIVAAVGLPVTAAKIEGLRSKLKRMVERGWLSEQAVGMFAVTEPVKQHITQ